MAAALALGLAPVAMSSLHPRFRDACRNPAALQATSLIDGSRPLGERLEERGPRDIQWSEGEIPLARQPAQPLHFQILRSYDARKLYEHTVRFASVKLEPEEHEVLRLTSKGVELPIHLVRDHTRSPSVVLAYLFAYRGRPVARPLLALLKDAPRQLLHGSAPLTLFLVEAKAPHRRTAAVEAVAEHWLVAAWHQYRTACAQP